MGFQHAILCFAQSPEAALSLVSRFKELIKGFAERNYLVGGREIHLGRIGWSGFGHLGATFFNIKNTISY